MKRAYTIALFAGVFAVAIGFTGLYGVSATTLMTTAIPQTIEPVGMLGHIDYVVRDADGFIKSYVQTDNIVTDVGNDCVARLAFENTADPGKCATTGEFQYIAIGNFTAGVHRPASTVNSTSTELDTDVLSTTACASSTVQGEMARKAVVPQFTTSNGAGTVVTLETAIGGLASPFQFDLSNKTTVYQSGVFDVDEAAADDVCTTSIETSNLFALQELSGDTGITVSAGDSLSIKWTITVGSAP